MSSTPPNPRIRKSTLPRFSSPKSRSTRSCSSGYPESRPLLRATSTSTRCSPTRHGSERRASTESPWRRGLSSTTTAGRRAAAASSSRSGTPRWATSAKRSSAPSARAPSTRTTNASVFAASALAAPSVGWRVGAGRSRCKRAGTSSTRRCTRRTRRSGRPESATRRPASPLPSRGTNRQWRPRPTPRAPSRLQRRLSRRPSGLSTPPSSRKTLSSTTSSPRAAPRRPRILLALEDGPGGRSEQRPLL